MPIPLEIDNTGDTSGLEGGVPAVFFSALDLDRRDFGLLFPDAADFIVDEDVGADSSDGVLELLPLAPICLAATVVSTASAKIFSKRLSGWACGTPDISEEKRSPIIWQKKLKRFR